MQPEHDRSRPGANRTASTNTLLGCPESTGQQLVGAIIWAGPEIRTKLFNLIGPGDLEDPASAAGFEALRWLHGRGVTDPAQMIQEFVALVHERRKAPRQPGDALPPRFSPGVETWIATCYGRVVDLGAVGAVALAMTVSGWGRRRQIAHLAARVHAVALDPQYDTDDVQAAVDRLLEVVGR